MVQRRAARFVMSDYTTQDTVSSRCFKHWDGKYWMNGEHWQKSSYCIVSCTVLLHSHQHRYAYIPNLSNLTHSYALSFINCAAGEMYSSIHFLKHNKPVALYFWHILKQPHPWAWRNFLPATPRIGWMQGHLLLATCTFCESEFPRRNLLSQPRLALQAHRNCTHYMIVFC